MFLIENFIDETSCQDLRKKIFAIPFVSGEYSAGEMASRVKSNLEIENLELIFVTFKDITNFLSKVFIPELVNIIQSFIIVANK